MKKLYRSGKNKMFAGVIGGIAEYYDIDIVILRLLWVLITVFTGFFPGIIAYIAAIFIVPKKTD
jgi:phage shock protein C